MESKKEIADIRSMQTKNLAPSFEKILAYQNVAQYLNKRDSESLRKKLNLTNEHLNRYEGKDFEERFFLMLLFRENIECIIPFDEQLAKILNVPSPDVIVILKNGEKILIELKATTKHSKKITLNRIKNQIAFSKLLGYPLYYLFSINDTWGLFSAEFVLHKNGKISIDDFLDNSTFEETFKIGFLEIPAGLAITCVSSSKVKNRIGLSSRYGTPLKYVVSYKEVCIEVPIVSTHWLCHFVTALIYFCKSNPSVEINGVLTNETFHFEKPMLTRDFDVILTLIDYTIDRKTNRFLNANGFIKFLLERGFNSQSIFSMQNLVRNSIESLQSAGIDIKLLEPK